MITGLRAPKLTKGDLRPPEVRSESCLNCGAPLTGPFCAQCGQRDVPPYPSVRELVTDAFWELSGWDGRFAGTVRALLAHPGKLTTEFLEGRRVRYVSPLRLYLLASLVYFLVAAAAPNLEANGTVVTASGFKIAVQSTGSPRGGTSARPVTIDELTPAQRDSALEKVDRAPAFIRPVIRRALADPTGFQRGLIESMPRVLFALVPVFAAIVALFYRRRKFPEHLYFSLHLHAFVFIALMLAEAANFTHVYALAASASAIVSLWIAIYAVAALRRVYRGTIAGTIAKAVAMGVLYSVVAGAAMLGLVYWAALFS